MSVPLVYPVLLYLLVRMLLAGLRPRGRPGRLVPHVPLAWLAVGAGVPGRVPRGPERRRLERDRRRLRRRDRRRPHRRRRPALRRRLLRGRAQGRHLRAGQLPALRAVRAGDALERPLGRPAGRPRRGDRLRPADDRRPAAAGPGAAARAGRGRRSASRWPTPGRPTPTRRSSLETNSNDTLVALACVAALLAYVAPLGRRHRAWRVGLGAAAKFAPLALAPLFARRRPLRVRASRSRRCWR